MGDEVANEVHINDFGRRAIMMARQTFSQKIRDFEKEKIVRERGVPVNHNLRQELQTMRDALGIEGLEGLLAGAVITEAVFSWPGIGSLLVNSIFYRDTPVTQGCILVIIIGFLVINLVVDLLYGVIDPRIKYQ